MGVKDQIRDLDEYQAQVQQESEAQQPRSPGGRHPGGQTVGTSLAPVLNWEKTDVDFWMQVAQVVLLYLILRELRRGA